MVLTMFLLVWVLAGVFGPQETVKTEAKGSVGQWLLIAEQSDVVLLQSLPDRQSAQLFLHPKQQPTFELVFAPIQQALLTIALLLPVLVVLAWYIRAGPRRSFRLGLWHDANLCCKSQLYH